jgi:hypothetical protein
MAAAFSLLASMWRKPEDKKSSTQHEVVNNYKDIMISAEQDQKLMSNNAY